MDNKRACRLIRSSRTYHGKQGFDYAEAISKESAESQGICMMLLTILPGVNRILALVLLPALTPQ